jgi:predicted signal transduction protein with EAL and GGDEF domain
VSRFGGDKYCILLPQKNALEAKVVAQSLMQSFANPFKVYEQTFILGCRIGISLFPANGQDAETLLKQADSALYVAKKLPGGLAFCSEEQAIYNRRRLKIEQGLRLAVATPRFDASYELAPVFQPLNKLPEETGLIFELSHWLKMEITETALMAAPEQSINTLQKIVDAGINVSIDDFGTGYSSLSYLKSLAYLKSLPATSIKIDQSFVRNLMTSPEDRAVVKAVISMSHSLGKRVTAEGVETQEQLDFLIAHQCHFAQGYLFSRPLTAASWIKKYGHIMAS